jgi:surfactin family lipopeptide synthetase A
MSSLEVSGRKRKLLDAYLRGTGARVSARQQPIAPRPRGESIPLSFAQQQVWVHGHMAGDTPIYNEAITVYRNRPTDAEVLQRCLAEIIRRHEIWRTTFDVEDGKPVQIVQPEAPGFRVKVFDLRSVPEPEREARALRIAAHDAQTPFDLKYGPLLRAALVRFADAEFRLYMAFHHIIFDGVNAYRVLLPELAALYEAFSAGKPSPLAEPDLQYGDYAYWQQKTLPRDTWAKQQSFWREKLNGHLPALQWPNERRRPAHQTYRGAVQRFELPASLLTPLRAFCHQGRVSSYMTLLASFACLLSRYTEQHDIILGGLSAGRGRPELEQMLGYFVNPVPLRIDLSGDPTFSQMAERMRDVVLDALAHDEIPFEKIVEALQLRPDPGRTPIFQIIVSQQPQMPAVDGWNLVTQEVSNGGSVLDLTLVIDERPDAISGPVIYNPDLFEPSSIDRLIEHWQTLLAAALADPDRHIAALPLLSASERQQLLWTWNDTKVSFPSAGCVQEMFEMQAERTPDAVALIFESKRMTYRELQERSATLAGHLQQLGVGPEVIVGIYLERSFEMVIAELGVLNAGGACLPIDAACPPERLAFMLDETRAPVVLTQRALAAKLPRQGPKVLCLDRDSHLTSGTKTSKKTCPSGPDNLAFLFYTSGSTGRPKGVQVAHRGLINCICARSAYEPARVQSSILLFSCAFDGSLPGIFWTLSTGGTLVLPLDQSRWDLRELLTLITRHKISQLISVPSLYAQLLEEATPDQLSSVQVTMVAGEQCPRELVEQHYRLLPHATLFNLYGPTETSVWTTAYRCEPNSSLSRVPIGKPIANVQVYVLDSGLQPLPLGAPGELYVGGISLARGYLNRPDLDEQRYVRNPFSNDPGSRLYKTGDLVRYLPDGNLEMLGRVDNQIKLRGFRIELEEIEAVIAEFKDVRRAVVVLQDDPHPRLVAYVVANNTRFKIEDLRSFLQKKLLKAMIPSAFVVLQSLPLTSNGKVDRRALPALESLPSMSEIVPPSNETEAQLLQLWQNVLDRQSISVTDDFFDLGGQSLLVVKLMLQVERTFGKKLSLQEVGQAPTIRKMAALLQNRGQVNPSSAIVPIQERGTRPALFWVRGGPLFVALAERLGSDQPLLGLHLLPSDIPQLPVPYKFEDVASALVRHMRAKQPEGPYYIAGLCVNGILAYEMALQLIEQGQEIGLLALFDGQNPEYYRKFIRENRGRILLQKAKYHIGNFRRLNRGQLGDFVRDRWAGVVRRANFSRWMVQYLLRREKKEQLEDLDAILQPTCRFYRPRPFPGQVVFFQSMDWPAGPYWDFSASWIDLVAGGLELHRIPGGHESMFQEPTVDLLASTFRRCLSQAQHMAELGQHHLFEQVS